jgi:cell surface protein SprA
MGNPNLGEVRGVLLGIENPKGGTSSPVNTEVWINEMRLSGLDESGGWAAVGQMNMQLSDLGSVSMSANIHTAGFGQLEQRVNDRYRDDLKQFDMSTTLQLGKLLPKEIGLEIPFFASVSNTMSSPKFDPFDKDIKLKDKYRLYKSQRDSIRNNAEDFIGLRTINFTNVRFSPKPDEKIQLWSKSNFDFSEISKYLQGKTYYEIICLSKMLNQTIIFFFLNKIGRDFFFLSFQVVSTGVLISQWPLLLVNVHFRRH